MRPPASLQRPAAIAARTLPMWVRTRSVRLAAALFLFAPASRRLGECGAVAIERGVDVGMAQAARLELANRRRSAGPRRRRARPRPADRARRSASSAASRRSAPAGGDGSGSRGRRGSEHGRPLRAPGRCALRWLAMPRRLANLDALRDARQVRAHRIEIGIARLDALLERAIDDRRNRRIEAGDERGERLGRFVQHLQQNRLLRLAAEGLPARDQLVEHEPDREDVAALIDLLADDLLGRHVVRRPHQHRRRGLRRRRGRRRRSRAPSGRPSRG